MSIYSYLNKIKTLITPPKKPLLPLWILPISLLTISLTIVVLTLINTKDQAPNFSSRGKDLYVAGNKTFETELKLQDGKPSVSFKHKTSRIELTLSNTTSATTNSRGKVVTYKNVAPSTDIRYTTLPTGLKEDLILNSVNSPSRFEFILKTSDAIPKNITSKHLTPTFYNNKGEYVFHFLPLYALDAAGDKTTNVNLDLKPRDDGTTLVTISLDENWLKDPNRKFPLTLDPSIVHDTTAEFAAGYFNRSFDAGSGSAPQITTAYTTIPSAYGTVGYWKLDEESGTVAYDSSKSKLSGTVTGATIVDGVIGKARSFNGSSNVVTIPISTNSNLDLGLQHGITLEAWVKPNSVGTLQGIIERGTTGTNGYAIRINTTGKFNLGGHGGNNFDGTTTVQTGRWYHVAGIINDAGSALYVNGKLEATGTVDVISSTINNVYLGAIWDGAAVNYYYNGVIDEAMVSNYAKSSSEILADATRSPYSTYTSPVLDLNSYSGAWNPMTWTESGIQTGSGETPFSTTNLVAQWNFNETSGTTLTNNAGSCSTTCNGTLTNFASTGSQDATPLSGWTSANKRWGTGALMFDGTNDYATVTDNANLDFGANNFSVSIWAKVLSNFTNYNGLLINKWNTGGSPGTNEWSLAFTGSSGSSREPRFTIESGSTMYAAASGTPATLGEWYHLVGVREGTNLKLYVNGKLEATTAIGSISINNVSGRNLNFARIDVGLYGNVVLDSAQIYSRALTAEEIVSNYQSSNIDVETRVGNSLDPNDGTWDSWSPTSGITPISDILLSNTALNFNSGLQYTSLYNTLPEIGGDSLYSNYVNPGYNNPNPVDGLPAAYTATTPHASYPDTGNAELTDGVLSGNWTDGKTVGYYNTEATIQFNTPTGSFSQVAVHFVTGTSSGVNYPRNAKILYVNASSTKTAGPLQCPPDTYSASAGWCTLTLPFPISASQLYIITEARNWIMYSEIVASQGDYFTQSLWRLDETDGPDSYLEDSTSNNLDLRAHNSNTETGVLGQARNLGGGYLSVADNSSIFGSSYATIEAWVNPRQHTNAASIINRRTTANVGGYTMMTNSTGQLYCYFYINGGWRAAVGARAMPLNTWTHVACTYDGYTLRAYVDGVMTGEREYSGTINNPSGPEFLIGRSVPTGNYEFNGMIDEIRISSISRPPGEIAETARLGRDYYMNYMPGTGTYDLSSDNTIAFDIAADTPGTYLSASISEGGYTNYMKDHNVVTATDSVGIWHMDENSNNSPEIPYDETNLVGHFHFNEGTGTVFNDISSSGNSMTFASGPTSLSAKYDWGVSCNGSSNYATYANTGFSNTNFTIEGWVYPLATDEIDSETNNPGVTGGTSNQKYLFFPNQGPGWGISMGTNGISVYEHNPGSMPPISVWAGSLSGWNHFAMVKSGATYYTYVNGVLVHTASSTYGSAVPPTTFCGGAYGYYQGYVDELRMYARSLNATEIFNNYSATQLPPQQGIIDDSGFGNHGLAIGTLSTTAGVVGNARYFNGTSDAIMVPYHSSLVPSAGTIEFWMKPNSLITGNIIDKRNAANTVTSYLVQISGTSKLRFASTGSFDFSSASTLSNNWTHVACTYDGTTAKIYLNGQLEATSAMAVAIPATTDNPLYISKHGTTNAGYYSGYLDEVRISEVARSAADIRTLYEQASRFHKVTVNFAARIDEENIISSSTDKNFAIDATKFNLPLKGSNLYPGDRLIVKEKYGATTYIAQGIVNSITASTGATTVSSWDARSTFPPGGFSRNARVFKWQAEYWDISNIPTSERDAIRHITLRITDNNVGHSYYYDNLRTISSLLTTPSGSTITSATDKRYLQYRVIMHSSDRNTTATFSAVTVSATSGPLTPTLSTPTNGATNQSLTPSLTTTTTDPDSNYLRYKIILCTDLAMTLNCQTFDQTSSQTGWSGQNTQSNTAYTSGSNATYTLTGALTASTTYYWQSYAIDPSDSNSWSSTQTTPYSFTTTTPPTAPTLSYVNGTIMPTNINTTAPYFSAIHNDPDGDAATYYEIRVNTAPDFSGTNMWTSALTAMTSTANGARSPDITYAGSVLNYDGQRYYWSIRFTDNKGSTGAWSEVSSFSLIDNALGCRIQESNTDTTLNVVWVDNASGESSWTVRRSTDGGAYSVVASGLASGTTSYLDSTVTQGHTYSYEILPYFVSTYGPACTTSTLNLRLGQFDFNGLNMNGLNLP